MPARSWNSVRVKPGQRTMHRTPLPASSSCTACVKLLTKAFVAPYVAFERRRLDRGDRRDVDDPARAARQHARQRRVRETRDRDDVEPDLLHLTGDRQLVVPAHRPEPGVVHEQVDRPAVVGEAALDGRDVGTDGEVGTEHLGRRAVRDLELLGQDLEARRVAGDDHEIVSTRGEILREGATDTGGCAGDESDGTGHAVLLRGPPSLARPGTGPPGPATGRAPRRPR